MGKEPTPNPTPSPTVRPSSSPTKNPTPVPTSPATGPTGKTIFAYPDIMNGHLHCLMDDLYPDYFLAGKNPQSMLFSSVQACCEAKGYPCTGEPSVTPTLAPTRKPTESPTPNPTKQPTAEPSVKPTPSPTRKPTESPTLNPTKQPTASPTPEPTSKPTKKPTPGPTSEPTYRPTPQPTYSPTKAPTLKPTTSPTSSTPKYWYPDIHALANHCVFGDNYEDWMDTADHRATNLFATKSLCCLEHNCDENAESSDAPPAIVLTYIDEDFDPGLGDTEGMWIHGGTTKHVADWHLTTHKAHSGTKSFRSGSLNHKRGKSSVVSLKLDSISGAKLSFWHYADVAYPFDLFKFKLDGATNHIEGEPSGEWMLLELGVAPGPHTISFELESHSSAVSVDRSDNVEQFGTGVVYVDDLQFIPFS